MHLPVILHYSSVFYLLIEVDCVLVDFSITAAPSVLQLGFLYHITKKKKRKKGGVPEKKALLLVFGNEESFVKNKWYKNPEH